MDFILPSIFYLVAENNVVIWRNYILFKRFSSIVSIILVRISNSNFSCIYLSEIYFFAWEFPCKVRITNFDYSKKKCYLY